MLISRFLPLLVLALCLMPFASAQKKTAAKAAPDASSALEQKIAAAAAALKDKVIAQRRDFHMHPELSNREERTGRVIAERLKEIGFTEIRTNVARNGVVAVLQGGKPGPVVAVRADIDALPINETMDVPYKSQNPGVKHACGHDAHAAVELGVAEVLFGLRDQIPGTIKFIFQPAEEGALESPAPQAIFGLHTNPNAEAGQIIYVPGAAMASSDRFLIDVTGKQAHGATPHNGIDAIVVSAQIINALQTIPSRRIRAFDPVVLTIGTVKGGDRFNVIAREVHMEGTLRTLNQEVRQRVKDLMKVEIEGIAKAADATATVTFNDGNFVLYNDPKLVDQTLPVMKRVLGEANVIKGEPMMPSEDFPEYTQQIPGFFYNLGTGNKARGITAGWHTPEYDVDEASLEVGVKLMSSILVDYLQRNAASVPGKQR